MNLLLKLVVNWLLVDVLIIATVWWFESTVRPLFPAWWKANICDVAPDYFN
jgi:hypothetical protein